MQVTGWPVFTDPGASVGILAREPRGPNLTLDIQEARRKCPSGGLGD